MRRFLITSPAFTGEAELLYNKIGILVRIDCTRCHMLPAIMKAFKAKVATDVADLQASFSDTKATIVEAGFVVTFDMWWTKYNKKINKARAMPIFEKLPQSEQVEAWAGIDPYDAYLSKNKWRTKADPDTFLRNKMYQNEY